MSSVSNVSVGHADAMSANAGSDDGVNSTLDSINMGENKGVISHGDAKVLRTVVLNVSSHQLATGSATSPIVTLIGKVAQKAVETNQKIKVDMLKLQQTRFDTAVKGAQALFDSAKSALIINGLGTAASLALGGCTGLMIRKFSPANAEKPQVVDSSMSSIVTQMLGQVVQGGAQLVQAKGQFDQQSDDAKTSRLDATDQASQAGLVDLNHLVNAMFSA